VSPSREGRGQMDSAALHRMSSAVASDKGPAGVGRPQRESRGISPRGYKRIGYAHLGFEHGIHDVVGDYCLPAKCKGDVQMVQDVIAQKKPWGESFPMPCGRAMRLSKVSISSCGVCRDARRWAT
jgi:hypothetical protein